MVVDYLFKQNKIYKVKKAHEVMEAKKDKEIKGS